MEVRGDSVLVGVLGSCWVGGFFLDIICGLMWYIMVVKGRGN